MNLAKANCTENRVCTSCETVVLDPNTSNSYISTNYLKYISIGDYFKVNESIKLPTEAVIYRLPLPPNLPEQRQFEQIS